MLAPDFRHQARLLQLFAVVTAAVLHAQPARAQVNLDEILIGIIEQRTAGVTDEWAFSIEVVGTDITTISLDTPPSTQFPAGETLDQTDFEQDDGDWLLEVPFASLAALQARFTTGTYAFTINGGAASVVFGPGVPDGNVAVSFPAQGAMMPNGQPTFGTISACTNCNNLEAAIEDDVGAIDFETTPQHPATRSSSFAFSDFGPNQGSGGPLGSLPQATPLAFCVLASVQTVSAQLRGDSDDFTYIQERGSDDRVDFTVVAPGLASDVEEASLEYIEFADEWFFAAIVDGTGITSASVIPPNAAPLVLSSTFPDEFEFEDGPFVDEDAVRAAHPPTDGISEYVFVIDGGERFYAADFAPGSPDAGIVITAPGDGATGVGTTPSFTVSNLCTNCNSQALDLSSEDGTSVILEALFFPPPFPSTIDFADFGPNEGTLGPISELPPGPYELEADTVVETFAETSFTPTDDFFYFAGTFREDAITFTVPEPALAALQLLALGAVVGIGRLRRGR